VSTNPHIFIFLFRLLVTFIIAFAAISAADFNN